MSKVGEFLSDSWDFITSDVGNYMDHWGDVINDNILQPVGEVAQAIFSDPANIAKLIVIFGYPELAPWLLPTISAVDTAVKGGDVWDVVKAAAITYATYTVSNEIGGYVKETVAGYFAADAATATTEQVATTNAIANLVASASGSAAGQAAVAVISGKPLPEIATALVAGGIAGAMPFVLGSVPGFTTLPKTAQNVLAATSTAALSAALAGKSVTQAAASAAVDSIIKSAGLVSKVIRFVQSGANDVAGVLGIDLNALSTDARSAIDQIKSAVTPGKPFLSDAQEAMVTQMLSSGMMAAMKGKTGDDITLAMNSALIGTAVTTVLEFSRDKLFSEKAAATAEAQKDLEARVAHYKNAYDYYQSETAEYNSMVGTVRERQALVKELEGKYRGMLHAFSSYTTPDGDRLSGSGIYNGTQFGYFELQQAEFAYNDARTSFQYDYNNIYKPQLTESRRLIEHLAAYLSNTSSDAQGLGTPWAVNEAMSRYQTAINGLTGPIGWATDTSNKAFVDGLLAVEGRTFNAEEYRVLNGLAADADVYAHYLQEGFSSSDPVYVNNEEAGPVLAAQRQAIYSAALQTAGVSQARVSAATSKKIFDNIDSVYGGSTVAMDTAISTGSTAAKLDAFLSGIDPATAFATGKTNPITVRWLLNPLAGFTVPEGGRYATPSDDPLLIEIYVDPKTGEKVALTRDDVWEAEHNPQPPRIPGEPLSINIKDSAFGRLIAVGKAYGYSASLTDILEKDPEAYISYVPTFMQNIGAAMRSAASSAEDFAADKLLYASARLAEIASDPTSSPTLAAAAAKAITLGSDIASGATTVGKSIQVAAYTGVYAAADTLGFIAGTLNLATGANPSDNIFSVFAKHVLDKSTLLLPAEMQQDVKEFSGDLRTLVAQVDAQTKEAYGTGNFRGVGTALAAGIYGMKDLMDNYGGVVVATQVLPEIAQEFLSARLALKVGSFAAGLAEASGLGAAITAAVRARAVVTADVAINLAEAAGGTYDSVYQQTYYTLKNAPETKGYTEEQLANAALQVATAAAYTNGFLTMVSMGNASPADIRRMFFKDLSQESVNSLVAATKKAFTNNYIYRAGNGIYKVGAAVLQNGKEEVTEDAPTIAVTNLMIADLAPSVGLASFNDAVQLAFNGAVGGMVGGTMRLHSLVLDGEGNTTTSLANSAGLTSAALNPKAPEDLVTAVAISNMTTTLTLGAAPKALQDVYSASSVSAAASVLNQYGISDPGMVAQVLAPLYPGQVTTYADVSNYFAANPDFVYNADVAAQFLGLSNGRNVQQEVSNYISANFVTVNDVINIAASEGKVITAAEAAQYAGQKNKAQATQELTQVFDTMAMSYQEVFNDFVSKYGYQPTSGDINKFVGMPEESAGAAMLAYADPRVVTDAEVRQMFLEAGYANPSDEEVEWFAGWSWADNYQYTQRSSIETYADPFVVDTQEVRNYLAANGITTPTNEDVARFVGQYAESELATRAAPFLDTIRLGPIQAAVTDVQERLQDLRDQVSTAVQDNLNLGNAILNKMQEYRAAGATAEQAVIKAIGDVSADLGVTKDALLARLGTTEQTIVAWGGTIMDKMQEYRAAGATAEQAITKAIEDVAADLGVTKDALLAQMGTTEQAIITEVSQAVAESRDVIQALVGGATTVPTNDDVTQAMQIMVGNAGFNAKYDWDGNGKVTLTDVQNLLKASTGRPPSTPPANTTPWAQPTGLYKTIADAVTSMGVDSAYITNMVEGIRSTLSNMNLSQLTNAQAVQLAKELRYQISSVENSVQNTALGIQQIRALVAPLQDAITALTVSHGDIKSQINEAVGTVQNVIAEAVQTLRGDVAGVAGTAAQLRDLIGKLSSVGITPADISQLLSDNNLLITESLSQSITDITNAVASANTELKEYIGNPSDKSGLYGAIADLAAAGITEAQIRNVIEGNNVNIDAAIGERINSISADVKYSTEEIKRYIGDPSDKSGLYAAIAELSASGLTYSQVEDLIKRNNPDIALEVSNAKNDIIYSIDSALRDIKSYVGVRSEGSGIYAALDDLAKLGLTQEQITNLLNSNNVHIDESIRTAVADMGGAVAEAVKQIQESIGVRDDGTGIYAAIGDLARAGLTREQVQEILENNNISITDVVKTALDTTEYNITTAVVEARQAILDAINSADPTTALAAISDNISALLLNNHSSSDIESFVGNALRNADIATNSGIGEQITTQTSVIAGAISQAVTDIKAYIGNPTSNTGLYAALAALKAAGLTQDQVRAITEGVLTSRDIATNATITAAIAQAVADIGAGVTTAISDAQAAILARMAEYRAAGATAEQALARAVADVAADLGTTREGLLAQLGTTESNLLSGVVSAKDSILAKMGEYEQAGMSRDQALSEAIQSVASSLSMSTSRLLSSIGTTQTALAAEIGGAKQAIMDLMTRYQQQGLGQYEALSRAIGEVAQALQTNEAALLNQLDTTKAELAAEIAGSQEAILRRMAEYEQAGFTRDQALQQAIRDSETGVRADISQVSQAVGQQGAAPTQYDLNHLIDLLENNGQYDQRYDYNQDNKVDQNDKLAIERYLQSQQPGYIPDPNQPYTFAPVAGSKWAPTGLYSEIDQLRNDLAAQNAATQKANAENAKTLQKQNNFNRLNELVNTAPPSSTSVTAPKVSELKYVYDWSSIFANPSQESLFGNIWGKQEFAQGGPVDVNTELLNLLRG